MSVAWYGKLPERWKTQKISELFIERHEKVSDTDFAPLSVSKGGIVPQIATVAKSNAGDNRKLVRNGDFAINSRSDRRGSSGVSEYDGSVSLINIVLTPRSETNRRYWHYLLKSHNFIEEYYRNGRGIVADLWTTRYTEMKTIYLPLPPSDEQDQIVRFLDWKVSQINRLINAKRRQIVLLMEISSGRVNEIFCTISDKTMRLSRCATKIGSGKTPRGGATVYVDSGILFIRSQNIYPAGVITDGSFYITNEIDENMKSTRVYPNDVLLNITGGSIGRCCVFTLDCRANVNQHVSIIRTRPDVLLPDFLAYYLNAPLGQEKITRCQNEGNRQSLTFVQIGAFDIPCPPIDKQKEKLEAIRAITKPVDEIVKHINNQITLLSEYRTQLISDVVTGKLDVRGVVVPEYVSVVEDSASDGVDSDVEDGDREEIQ